MSSEAVFEERALQSRRLLDAMMRPTGDHYQSHLRDFAGFMDERDGDVTLDAVRDYFIHLHGRGYAANTVRIKRQAVKKRMRVAMVGMDFNQQAMLDQAIKRLDKDTLTRAPSMQPTTIGQDKVIRRDEYDRLLQAATPRDRLLLRFLWATGCRVSELTGARMARIRVEDGKAFVPVLGKNSKERTVQVKAALFEEIRAVFNGSTFLFETSGGKPLSRVYISSRIHGLALRVLGRRFGAHQLRHSMATRKVRNHPEQIPEISRYLGHASVAVTLQFYSHNPLSTQDLLFDPDDD